MSDVLSTGLSLEVQNNNNRTLVNIVTLKSDDNNYPVIAEYEILDLQVAIRYLQDSKAYRVYAAKSMTIATLIEDLRMQGCPIRTHSMTGHGRRRLYRAFYEEMSDIRDKNDDCPILYSHATRLFESLYDKQADFNSNKSLAFALAWHGWSTKTYLQIDFA